MTDKPVKFGTVTPELVAFAVQDFYYKDVRERIWALERRVQRGAARARRRGLPRHPDGRAADPLARGARRRRQDHQPRVHARGVQQHRARAAREDRSLVPHVLGQPVAAAHVRASAELQARAEDPEQGRRRRHHVRVVQLRRHGSRGHRPRDHGHEDRDRRHRPPLAASREPDRSRGSHPHGAEAHSGRAARCCRPTAAWAARAWRAGTRSTRWCRSCRARTSCAKSTASRTPSASPPIRTSRCSTCATHRPRPRLRNRPPPRSPPRSPPLRRKPRRSLRSRPPAARRRPPRSRKNVSAGALRSSRSESTKRRE